MGALIVPQSLARLYHRKDLTYRPIVDAPTCPVSLAFPEGPQPELVEEFIGIVRGRKPGSSRGQAQPAPKRTAREKTLGETGRPCRRGQGRPQAWPGQTWATLTNRAKSVPPKAQIDILWRARFQRFAKYGTRRLCGRLSRHSNNGRRVGSEGSGLFFTLLTTGDCFPEFWRALALASQGFSAAASPRDGSIETRLGWLYLLRNPGLLRTTCRTSVVYAMFAAKEGAIDRSAGL